MGAIREGLMSKGQTMTRKDGDKFTMYKDGGKVKSRVNEAGNYTKPGLRKSIFERIKAGGKGGAPGQWSARKAQMMAQQYKKAGGGLQRLKAPQKSLKDWGDQKWRTKSGKPSTQGPKATGERYLPEKAIKALSPAEYAASTKAKRAGKAAGKQFVKQPGSIAKKTARFR
jgi:hypothetical protein